MNPEGQAFYEQGEAALDSNDIKTAFELLSKACERMPHHGAAHHLLGKVASIQGDHSFAETLQRRSCQLDPSLGWNWFALADLLERREAWLLAADAFQWAHQTLPQEQWIVQKIHACQQLALLGGEHIEDGLGPVSYRLWCDQIEGQLPSEIVPVQQEWIEVNHFEVLNGEIPSAGWLLVLGTGYRLRSKAKQAFEAWLDNWGLEQPDLITVDEDRIDSDGQRYDPWFKPSLLAESSWSTPWFEGLSAWSCSWLREHQLGWPPQNSIERFQWLLHALSFNPKHKHIHIALCHCEAEDNTGENLEAKARLLRLYLRSKGEPVIAASPDRSGFRFQWALPKNLSCSLIIPTRDRADLLDVCLSSVEATTESTCLDLHWMIVDNGSCETSTLELFRVWGERMGDCLTLVRDDELFNWSRLNNQAAKLCATDLLLFLNNDIEAVQSGWLDVMAAQAVRKSVGCVGAILCYPDQTIQHAGVVVGMHYGADHAYRGLPLNHDAHRGRSSYLSDWGAVTGACMMVDRLLFNRVGGFDQSLPVEFNDIDFCLRLGQLGYRHVIDPQAVLVHHESQSRDARHSQTAGSALSLMQSRWKGRLQLASPWWPTASAQHNSDGRPIGFDRLLSIN